MSLEIILIRHGETEYNREGRIQGGQDSPLTEKGVEDTRRLASWMRKWLGPVDAWYSSPLPRALQTSRLLREGLSRTDLPAEETDDRLREIRCGEYEGRIRDELDAGVMKRLKVDPHLPYPGGESLMDVILRTESFVHEVILAHAKKAALARNSGREYRIVIIGHGHLNRSLASVLTGLGPLFAIQSLQENTAVNRLRSSGDAAAFRLVTWNETAHLIP